MKIEVEIKPISFTVLGEEDIIVDKVPTIDCLMSVDFGIFINDSQKAVFTERVRTTYLNEIRGTEMDEARQQAINDYINNLPNTKQDETKRTSV